MKPFCVALLLSFLCWNAMADPSVDRAEFNYMVHCRGCHGPNGEGSDDRVPNLHGEMGKFLYVAGGREFLVQVPGSANAAIDDQELAALLNWMLGRFSPEELPVGFQPYSAPEVGSLRQEPLMEVDQLRATLVALMPAR